MNTDAKKTALRMFPYGLFVLTAEDGEGTVAAATINWVMQSSFSPPLVAVGVKVGSRPHTIIEATGAFALNALGKGQGDVAYTFFKPHDRDGESIGGQALDRTPSGLPVLADAQAWIECKVVECMTPGDHSVVVAEVTRAFVADGIDGRPDEAILWLKELGDKLFYGG